MVENLTIIISSRKDAEEGQEYINHIKETCGCPAKIIFVSNKDGAMGLTELYGSMLSNKDIKSRYMAFIHDDLSILRPGFGKELIRLFNNNPEYGIIGVAGSDYFDDKDADEAGSRWWAYKGHIWGQVLHRDLEHGKSWLTEFSPLIEKDLEEVCVVDGLFFAVDRKKIKKNFDSSLKGFNFYEIDFCLANFLEGVKVGVTTNIRIAHNSLGAMKPNWYENRDIVCEKYKDDFPIFVNKKNKRRK